MMINDQWHHDHYSGLSIGRKASAQDQRRSELGGVENIEHVVLVKKIELVWVGGLCHIYI